MFTRRVVLTAAMILALGLPAFGTPIMINDTGLGTATPGTIDPNWTLISPSAVGGPAYEVSGSPSGYPFPTWLINDAASQWIAPRGSYPTSTVQDAAGTWIFTTTFALSGFASAAIAGQMWSDNLVTNVILNGNPLGITTGLGVDPLNTPTAFNITSGFVEGSNTLSFYVNNIITEGAAAGPVGLRVDITSAEANPVPEPVTFGLIGLGLLGLAAVRRLRWNS